MKKLIENSKKSLNSNNLDMLYSYDCLIECWNETYALVIDYCLKNNIKSVTDIGTAFSSQGAEFNQQGIEYNVINEFKEHDPLVNIHSFQTGFYGKDEFQTKKDSLAVAILSIGWKCYVNEDEKLKQIQELSKDFNTCMLYLPNDKYLNDYFKHVERIKGNMYLVSNR